MKNRVLILLLLSILLIVSCEERDAKFEDFDMSILPILKEFQIEMLKNDSIVQVKSKKNDKYRFLHASSFNTDLPFLSDGLRKKMQEISEKKKILRLDYNRNCITIGINRIGNSFKDDEWLELDLVYHDSSKKEFEPCISRSYFSEQDYSNVKQIDNCWFLILSKNRRYIRG
jgi:hypothetical protein